jgi:hypothetical protein
MKEDRPNWEEDKDLRESSLPVVSMLSQLSMEASRPPPIEVFMSTVAPKARRMVAIWVSVIIREQLEPSDGTQQVCWVSNLYDLCGLGDIKLCE